VAPAFVAPFFDRVDERERRGERAARVVRRRLVGTEDRHEAVAQMLVDGTAMRLDDRARARVEIVEERESLIATKPPDRIEVGLRQTCSDSIFS
jgi:hypothetical protein